MPLASRPPRRPRNSAGPQSGLPAHPGTHASVEEAEHRCRSQRAEVAANGAVFAVQAARRSRELEARPVPRRDAAAQAGDERGARRRPRAHILGNEVGDQRAPGRGAGPKVVLGLGCQPVRHDRVSSPRMSRAFASMEDGCVSEVGQRERPRGRFGGARYPRRRASMARSLVTRSSPKGDEDLVTNDRAMLARLRGYLAPPKRPRAGARVDRLLMRIHLPSMRTPLLILGLLTLAVSHRLAAQTDYYLRAGATAWSTLVTDFIAQDVRTRPAAGPRSSAAWATASRRDTGRASGSRLRRAACTASTAPFAATSAR